MNTCIEDVRVQNDHAIRCSIVCKPVSVIEYVKAVSSVIGASHILAVFEENDSIKIFLNDKRYVDTLMKSCLHVMGHHVKVDYVCPPGTRLVLTDIDPIVSNFDVMRLLSVYGSIVSPVIRPPVSDDTELCHIGYGVRYVYMNLTTENLPEKIEFKYGEHMCCFKLHVENEDIVMLANIKVDTFEDARLENENSNSSVLSQDLSSPPILVSVQSVNSNEEGANTQLLTSADLPNGIINQEISIRKRRGRPPNPAKRLRIAKTVTATSKAARKIKRNVKHKWIRRRYRKGRADGKQMIKAISLIKRNARKPSNSSSSCNSTLPDIPSLLEQRKEECEATNEIWDQQRVLEYLDEIKNHRAPLEVTKKYFGDDCDSIKKLIAELNIIKQQQSETSLKNRIWRLVKLLKDTFNSNQNISSDMID